MKELLNMRQPEWYITVLLLLIPFAFLKAQSFTNAFLEASSTKGAQEFFYHNSQAQSGSYLYVAGASLNNDGNYDILLTKYHGTTEIWSVEWNGSANDDDYATDVMIDASGRIVVVGTSTSTTSGYDGVVLKYDQNGTLLWDEVYDAGSNLMDGFASVVTDASDNIYTCGATLTSSEVANYLTVKFNSSGTVLWSSTYDYNDLQDIGVKLVLGGSTVRVTGVSQDNSLDWSIATISYDDSNGNELQVRRVSGTNNGLDEVSDISFNGLYTYIAGSVVNSNGYDWKVLKLNYDLTINWSVSYNNSANEDDKAKSIKVDDSGNVYVTGFETTTLEDKNYLTRAYNSNGTLLWSKSYDNQNGEDRALTLELNSNDDVIISGTSYQDGNLDFLTIKYKGTSGDEIWWARFNSDYNQDDVPTNIAIDVSEEIYVIGTIGVTDSTTTYITCKYSEKDILLPAPEDGFSQSGGYITNKGQLRDADSTSNSTVKFYNTNHRVATYIENEYVYYQLIQAVDSSDVDSTFLVRMNFKGSNNNKVYPIDPRPEYHNYYLGHMMKKSERTEIVNTVIRPESYTNTDLLFTHSPNGFRHYIIAEAGSPTSSIQMTFSGQNALSIDVNGNLHIETTLGDIVMTKPRAYSMNNSTGELTLLGWQPSYSISNNDVSFSGINSWAGTLVLEFGEETTSSSTAMLIENLEWSTCFGGNLEDILNGVATDQFNYCWVVGSTKSSYFPLMGLNIGYEYSGNKDGVLGQFNHLCEPEYLMFYGGSEEDEFSGIDVGRGVYLCGFTHSNDLTDYSDSSLDDSNLDGESDGIYVKLNDEGIIIVDSYIGGTELDHCTDIDVVDNPVTNKTTVYLCGPTDSDDFYVTGDTNAYVSANSGDNDQDSFFMKLEANTGEPEVLEWSTCIGADVLNTPYGVASVDGSLVVTGYIASSATLSTGCGVPPNGEFPSCYNLSSWPGVTSTNNLGYIMIFDENNELFYSVVFPGGPRGLGGYSDGYIGESIGHFAIGGGIHCDAVADFPFEGGGFQQDDCTNSVLNGFIMKFRFVEEDVTLVYATLLGKADDGAVIEDVNMNSNLNIFFTGYGNDISNLQNETDYCMEPDPETMPLCNSTDEAYMETDLFGLDDERSFLGVINNNFDLSWCTLFGDGNENRANAITSNDEKLFLVGQSDYNWTLEEFDESTGSFDYFRDENSIQFDGPPDGSITRFQIAGIFEMTTEIAEVENSEYFLISPNPTDSYLNISYSGSINCSLRIFNNVGQLVYLSNDQPISRPIDVSMLARGLYCVELHVEGKKFNQKFIKL